MAEVVCEYCNTTLFFVENISLEEFDDLMGDCETWYSCVCEADKDEEYNSVDDFRCQNCDCLLCEFRSSFHSTWSFEKQLYNRADGYLICEDCYYSPNKKTRYEPENDNAVDGTEAVEEMKINDLNLPLQP